MTDDTGVPTPSPRKRLPAPDRSAVTPPEAAYRSRVIGDGTPVFTADDDGWIATFTVSADRMPPFTAEVFLDVNCVTDRSRIAEGTMRRDPDGRSWTHSVRVPSAWRGSYAFIPSAGPIDGPEDGENEREWWIRFRRNATGTREGAAPDAPPQRFRTGEPPAGDLHTSIVVLDGTPRRVHTYLPPLPGRGTVLLFDGDEILAHGVLAAFDGTASPARVVAVEHVGADGPARNVRASDLTANPRFRDELLALVDEQVIVGGCSYGGLASMFFALTRPDIVAGAACLSPSMWWHDDRGRDVPTIAEADRGGRVPIFCEAGSLEWMMLDEIDSAVSRLGRAGHPVRSARFAGGHDWVQWRERLPALVAELLPDPHGPENGAERAAGNSLGATTPSPTSGSTVTATSTAIGNHSEPSA
ncbi:DUF3327 domain-containing protein [Rhodococcus rhodochrous]|nr:DUF3327 domain-containing protein [Rhodococcus rhodochrous]QOH54708.1 hypothetical protein C6Y44_01020 [Rhodococcus rhodochrous]